MSKKPITVICICLGLVLLAVSALWPYVMPSETYWGDQQQSEFTEALRHAHELEMDGGKRGNQSKDARRQELEAAQAYRQQQLDKLEQAKADSQRPGRICFWLGLVVAAAGVLGYRYSGNESG